MRLSQILRNGFIRFELDARGTPPEEPDYDLPRHVRRVKREIISELSDLFAAGNRVANRNKLFLDLWNREKKASTAVGQGLALPHVRTQQARELVLGFARSSAGLPFDAPDGRPVHIFLALVGPRHEEAAYLRVYRAVAELFSYPAAFERLMEATEDWQVLRIIDGQVH